MTIAEMGRLFPSEIRSDEHEMRSHRVQVGKVEGRKYRSCEEVQDEHTREIRNHIETGKEGIGTKLPSRYIKSSPLPHS